MAEVDRPAAALAIFCLVVVAVVALVAAPLSLPLPRTARRLTLTYAWAPALGVALAVAVGAMSPADVGRGIAGDERIKPYGILILFLSTAFISNSLDMTGCFAYAALRLTRAAGGRGRRLFVAYFCLSSFITLFTSNDVTIMTLTPIICYFARATGADPEPYVAAQFVAANVWCVCGRVVWRAGAPACAPTLRPYLRGRWCRSHPLAQPHCWPPEPH